MNLKKTVIFFSALIFFGLGLFAAYRETTSQFDEFKYLFKIKATNNHVSEDIIFYEARIKRDRFGAVEPAILAGLFLERFKLTASNEDYAMSEQYARMSLKNRKAFNTAANLVLADLAQAKHHFREALNQANEIKKTHSGEAAIYPILIKSYLALGNLDAALASANTFIQIMPSTLSYTFRALVHQALSKNFEAFNDFQKALKMEEPGHLAESIWTRNLLGRFLAEQKKFEAADFVLNENLRLSNKDALTYGNLAILEENQKHFIKAETYFQKAFSLSKQITYMLGESRMKMALNSANAIQFEKMAESLLRQELATDGMGHRSELIKLLLSRQSEDNSVELLKLARDEVNSRPNAESQKLLALVQIKVQYASIRL